MSWSSALLEEGWAKPAVEALAKPPMRAAELEAPALTPWGSQEADSGFMPAAKSQRPRGKVK